MAGALLGAISCGRCGYDTGIGSRFCERCGVHLLPAAEGRVVGTYSGMLANVYPARALQRNVATAIDVAPLAVAVAIALTLAVASSLSAPGLTTIIVLVAAYVAAMTVVFTRYGRTLGRLAMGLRTVDDLTGSPVDARSLVRERLSRRRRTVTADLRRGRDPLEPARQAMAAVFIMTGEDRYATPQPSRGRAAANLAATDTVTVVLDNDEQWSVSGVMLIGRAPENRAGEENQLFPVPDLSRSLSKTHALLEWAGTVLWVTDLASTNGSALVSPDGERQILAPGLRGAATIDWTVELGQRSFTLQRGTARAT